MNLYALLIFITCFNILEEGHGIAESSEKCSKKTSDFFFCSYELTLINM